MKISTVFKSISKSLLLLTFFTPFVVTTFSIFPYEYGKTIFFTSLVEWATIFFLLYFVCDFKAAYSDIRARFSGKKNIVLWASLFFLVSTTISTIFAQLPYISFWGNVDRHEGLVAFLFYGGFVSLAYILFNKADWYLYYCGLLVSAILLSVVGWMEFLGFSGTLIIKIKPSSQPGSFAGNPVYLSSFLTVFLTLTAAIFDWNELKKKRWLVGILALLFISTIIITGIRGEFLGLLTAAGILVLYAIFKGGNKKIKVAAILLTCLFAIMVGVFLETRSNPFWLKVPTIGRFATLNPKTSSYASRLYSWQAAWDGFKERPLLGWGQESYNMVFSKYGSAKVAQFGDDWFDRSHNKILDVLVYTGSIGLLAYLLLWGSVIYTFRKKPLFVAFFGAYFVQNLFIFDTNLTYLVVSVMVAFAAQVYGNQLQESEHPIRPFVARKWLEIGLKLVAVLGVPALLYVFYTMSVVTFRQQVLFSKFVSAPTFEERVSLLHDMFNPFNSTQPRMRMFVNQMMRDWKSVGRLGGAEATLTAVEALEEAAQYDPLEIRYFMRLSESYMELANTDPKYFEKAEFYARRGTELAPQELKLYYLLTFILSRENKYDPAVNVQARAVELDPQNARSHLYYALTLLAAGDKSVNPYFDSQDPKFINYLHAGAAELQLTQELGETKIDGTKMRDGNDFSNAQYSLFEKSDFNNLALLLTRTGDIQGMLKAANIGLHVNPNDDGMYQYIVSTFVFMKDAERVNTVLENMKYTSFAHSYPIEKWQQLAKDGKWDELEKEPFVSHILVLLRSQTLKLQGAAATATAN